MEHAHPGGSLGYKLTINDLNLVFCTDVEHLENMTEIISEFAKGADLLAYDSQYYFKEYDTKIGWGHSCREIALEIAHKAKVKELHLIHHDPMRTDADLREIEGLAKKEFPNVMVSREGLSREFSVNA